MSLEDHPQASVKTAAVIRGIIENYVIVQIEILRGKLLNIDKTEMKAAICSMPIINWVVPPR